MYVVLEAVPMRAHQRVQLRFAGVGERWMSDVVDQRQGFGKVRIQTQRARNRPRDLCDF